MTQEIGNEGRVCREKEGSIDSTQPVSVTFTVSEFFLFLSFDRFVSLRTSPLRQLSSSTENGGTQEPTLLTERGSTEERIYLTELTLQDGFQQSDSPRTPKVFHFSGDGRFVPERSICDPLKVSED